MATDRDRARWALRDDRTLPPDAKYVWLMLDTRGEKPYPSIRTLAADCGMSRNRTKRALRALVAAGWLVMTSRTTPEGDADSYFYELKCPGQTGVGPERTHPVGPERTHGGSTADPKDQTEGQPGKTKVSSVSSVSPVAAPQATGADDNDENGETVTLLITAAICVRWGLGHDDRAAFRYLHRTVWSPGKRHADPYGYARYLARMVNAATAQMSELADLGADGWADEDTALELLAEARQAAAGCTLSDSLEQTVSDMVSWAERCPDRDLEPHEALDAAWDRWRP